jgi:hypothetical protein
MRDLLARRDDVVQQPGEIAAGVGDLALLFDDELDQTLTHYCSPLIVMILQGLLFALYGYLVGG